jgi:ribosomal protein S18 acetylase RimI-like enzyme
VIRRAGVDDAELLLELWRAAEAAPTVTNTLEDVTKVLESPAASVFIAELDGKPIGSVIATWDGWRGHLYRLAVLPAHRRRGIASALVRTGEDELRHRGARRANAIVLLAEDPATSFWASTGYRRQHEAGRYTKMLDS